LTEPPPLPLAAHTAVCLCAQVDLLPPTDRQAREAYVSTERRGLAPPAARQRLSRRRSAQQTRHLRRAHEHEGVLVRLHGRMRPRLSRRRSAQQTRHLRRAHEHEGVLVRLHGRMRLRHSRRNRHLTPMARGTGVGYHPPKGRGARAKRPRRRRLQARMTVASRKTSWLAWRRRWSCERKTALWKGCQC
jgi:hypothetical protein